VTRWLWWCNNRYSETPMIVLASLTPSWGAASARVPTVVTCTNTVPDILSAHPAVGVPDAIAATRLCRQSLFPVYGGIQRSLSTSSLRRWRQRSPSTSDRLVLYTSDVQISDTVYYRLTISVNITVVCTERDIVIGVDTCTPPLHVTYCVRRLHSRSRRRVTWYGLGWRHHDWHSNYRSPPWFW